jgi:hypothetical protein
MVYARDLMQERRLELVKRHRGACLRILATLRPVAPGKSLTAPIIVPMRRSM